MKKIPKEFNCSVGNVTDKSGNEAFQWKKFKKVFDLKNGVEWAKDFASLFNLRKLVIVGVILSCIFGYGYWKGRAGKPVKFNLDYEKAFRLNIDGKNYLVKPKNSNNMQIEDKKGNVVKVIRAKDLPGLSEKLKPIGFVLDPIFVVGYGVGSTKSNTRAEFGAGVDFIKYWKWKLNAFITSCPAIYIGTTYQITDNSGVGIGVGKGLSEGDNRVIIFWKWKF